MAPSEPIRPLEPRTASLYLIGSLVAAVVLLDFFLASSYSTSFAPDPRDPDSYEQWLDAGGQAPPAGEGQLIDFYPEPLDLDCGTGWQVIRGDAVCRDQFRAGVLLRLFAGLAVAGGAIVWGRSIQSRSDRRPAHERNAPEPDRG